MIWIDSRCAFRSDWLFCLSYSLTLSKSQSLISASRWWDQLDRSTPRNLAYVLKDRTTQNPAYRNCKSQIIKLKVRFDQSQEKCNSQQNYKHRQLQLLNFLIMIFDRDDTIWETKPRIVVCQKLTGDWHNKVYRHGPSACITRNHLLTKTSSLPKGHWGLAR